MSQSNSTSSSGRGGRNSSNAARGRGRGRGREPSHGGRGTGQARTNGGRGTRRAPPSNMGGRAPFAGVGHAGPIRGTGTGVASAGRAHSRVSTAKSNGDKGAEIHTVSESDRINLTRVLMTLRESDQASATFSPQLTNTERKFVHSLAAQLGLVSKSNGKGDNRCITVTKRAETKKKTGVADEQEEAYPTLQVGARGIAALKQHIHNHPPTDFERKESFETGSSLMGDTNDASLNETLAGMGFGSNHKITGQVLSRPINIDLARRARQHASAQKTKVTHPAYRRMQDQRHKLPAWSYRDAICQVVAANSVTVLSGETGCGKSTQVPQFLLDNDPTANIVVTQPRRISAIAVAERVASEQCLEPIGGMVGYQVRLESAMSASTQLLFLTPGVLLRKLQSSPMLMEFTYIIIDEIHERDKYTEFLLIALKEILPSRPDLRIVLMSATLQIQTLIDYWYDVGGVGPPGQISIPGRTFPVQEFFLEDILTMTKYLDEKEVDSTDQLEAAMAMLLAKKNQHHQLAPKKNSQKKQHPTAISQVEMDEPLTLPSDLPSFSCVMCNRSGFSSPNELGEHIAFCDGGAGESMAELEDRVRNIAVGQTNGAAVATSSNRGLEDTMFEDYDASDNDDNSESDESKTKKWNGEGVFEMSDPSTEPVTTEEEEKLLTQYQAVHNDEKIDDALLLEVIQLIVASSNGNGAILVFFPGWGEISEFLMLLESTPPFYNRNKYLILPLHSGIPSYDQRKVFEKPPKGVRKIILSTNIAETSVTIDDVSFVVDTGRAKEKSYDPHLKTSTLAPTWISQASAKQRKGRAGRTKRGVAFRLFSKRRYESFRPFVESELLRTPLEEMCLQSKQLGLAPGGPEDDDGVPAFLAKAMSPPHEKSVSNALELLVELGAMEPETNELTSLGRCLSVLSLEPRVGKMVIYSHLLGCARAAACMGVAMSYKSPFILPPPSMQRSADLAKVELSQGSESDQVTILYAINERDKLFRQNRQGAFKGFCDRNFLGMSTLQMIGDLRENVSRELVSLGFPKTSSLDGYHNRHDRKEDLSLWQAAIAAGLYPNVAFRSQGEANFSTMTNRKARIHVSSLNAARGQPLNGKCQVPVGEVEFVAFGEMVRGVTSFTMSQTTHLASALPLMLLCGTALRVSPADSGDTPMSILSLDDWIVMTCPADTASALMILRKRVESAFWRITGDPSAGMSHLTAAERDAVETVVIVLQSGHGVTADR